MAIINFPDVVPHTGAMRVRRPLSSPMVFTVQPTMAPYLIVDTDTLTPGCGVQMFCYSRDAFSDIYPHDAWEYEVWLALTSWFNERHVFGRQQD